MTEKKRQIERLFRQHYRAMYRLACILMHDTDESKDIVHDVFAQLLTNNAPLNEATARAFLLSCVRNRCLNVIRNRKSHERVKQLLMLDEDLETIPDNQCLLRSANALGHGISEDVTDVVYVKAGDDFTAANNPAIARDIEKINQHVLDAGTNYVLVGPGRWGSSDPWLGVPVKWPHISAARVIVETTLKNYHVDPSQGTHFFQNLTSFGVGYFTIDTDNGSGLFRQDVLDQLPAVEETEYVRHVRFPRPLKIMMDGKKQLGVVLLPAES